MEPVEELRYLVLGAQREGNRLLTELLKPIGITPAQAEVLAVLRDADRALTVRELGDRLVCESGSPSRLVASVVASGLVERREHETDGRATALRLTPKGHATARRISEAERQLYDALLAVFPERDVVSLNRMLRKFVEGRATGAAIARRRTSG